MKMIVVTSVDQYRDELLQLFGKAGVERFSGSDISGYRENPELLTGSWFPTRQGGSPSNLFFSFAKAEKVGELFRLLEEFNREKGGNNPVRAVEVSVERFI